MKKSPLDKMLFPNQKSFFLGEQKRINILVGSVRSGKTYVSLLKFAMFVANSPKQYEFIMCGKTLMTLKRNCFGYLLDLVGQTNFQFSTHNKEARLFGRTVWLEGANDDTSEFKIRGMTLAGAYCDELTLFPESFFNMLLSRLSIANAKLWGTCNPDNPKHFIKEKYIDRVDNFNMNVYNFLLTDNIFLDKNYVENIQKEYVGVYYKRYILGLWARAEGCIYPKLANNPENYIIDIVNNDIFQINVGVDFGGNESGTTFVAVGFTKLYKDVIVLENERITEQLSPDELEDKFGEFCKKLYYKYKKPFTSYCDSSEVILIKGLKQKAMTLKLPIIVKYAKKNKIVERIKLLNKLIGLDRFKIKKGNDTVTNALCDAIWKKDTVKDERLDDGSTNIDTLDALEYAIEPQINIL